MAIQKSAVRYFSRTSRICPVRMLAGCRPQRQNAAMGRSTVMQHNSALGRWTRALYFPDAPLAAHVDLFWYVSGHVDYTRDRRLPTGRTHLLFNLGSPAILFGRDPATAPRQFPTCWISGQQQSFIETGAHGDAILVGAQFASHGAYRLLRIAQHELSDRVIELESLLGDRVLGVRQRLLDAQTPQACFGLLEQWLLGLLERGAQVHPAVLATSHAVNADPGQLQLKALSRDLGFSREHLIRRFREQIGLTPKAFANILRFGQALKFARRRNASWAQIALDAGYYDQAHLVRDFQRYAGRPPSSLLEDRMPDADSIVIS
jgi:AraC-like DNA-binding protein